MKLSFTAILISLIAFSTFAQNSTPKKTLFVFEKQATVNVEAITTDYNPKLMVKEMPKQRGEKVENFNYPADYKLNQAHKAEAVILPTLSVGQSFSANIWGISTPNDNDMAISDSGMVCSVINTNIFVRNTVNNTGVPYKSLNAFTSPINNFHQEFDPKVMYDPKKDRFVLVCLVGSIDVDSKIIIGFSQTNNPAGNWNLYQLPGNPLNNNLWSDYPMIAMTETELFLTVNLLVNNQPWQTGFVETLVWQLKKDKGYAGLPLGAALHSNINFNGKKIRNLCPVKGGSKLYKPNMYFISNRNLANQNDSVFLVNITDTIGAPGATLTTTVMVSNQPYYFPNPARQQGTLDSLATNDSRNLGAFFENNKIQYVHNSNNPLNNQPTIYYGIINNPAAVTPTATGYLLVNDTVDFGYPNISYAGNSPTDNTAIINFNHSSKKIYTGCSAIRTDAAGDFSPIRRIQNGVTYVNLLAGTLERWGDYSGSQRRYCYPGEVWISGYYAYTYNFQYPYAHAAWVAQIGLSPNFVTRIKNETKSQEISANIFPNPTSDIFGVDIILTEPEYLNFELYDAQGKLIQILMRDLVKVKQNTFNFSTRDLGKGIYYLKITGDKTTKISKKVLVE